MCIVFKKKTDGAFGFLCFVVFGFILFGCFRCRCGNYPHSALYFRMAWQPQVDAGVDRVLQHIKVLDGFHMFLCL